MDYFDQIIEGSEENVRLMLGQNPEKLTPVAKKALFKRNVEIINLELSYECNRKCDYCPVKDSNRMNTQSLMSFELVSKIAQELKEIRYENRVSLNLYNEPLLDPTLEEKVEILRHSIPFANLGLNSNGDKLNAKRLESLSNAGLDYICVTLHPKPYRVDSKDTLHLRINKLLEKIERPMSPPYEMGDEQSVEVRSKGVRVKVQWPNWREQGTARASLLGDHIAMKVKRDKPCVKPFRELTIFYDGKVQPCCESFHDDAVNLVEMGDLNQETIFDVYASQRISEFRKSVFAFGPKTGICEHCNIEDYSSREKDQKRREFLIKEQF